MLTPLPLPHQDSLHRHPIVWLVAAISCIPFLLLSASGLDAISGWFMPNRWAALPSSFWKLWTPVFVHYTILHLLTNLYLWWYFAAKIETQSKLELVIVVVLSAAISNLCQWLVTGPNFGGLSGVVYALLGYTWMLQRFESRKRYQLDQTMVIVLLALIPLSATGIFGKFSDFSHIGGLLTGALLAFIALKLFNHPINNQTDTKE